MIVDSSAWIAMLRATGSLADQRLRQALQQGEPMMIPEAVYREVLQGATNPQHFMRLQAQLEMLPLFVPDDALETARHAALLYARCRWQGFTIRSPNDCLIAACAIEAGEPLLQADRDFEHIARIDPRLHFV